MNLSFRSGHVAVGFMGIGACILDKESDMPCELVIEILQTFTGNLLTSSTH